MSVFGYQPYRLGIKAVPSVLATIPYPLYLDSEASNGGDGTRSAPLNSLTTAMSLAAGRENWLIKIRAPESTPFRVEPVSFQSTQPLTLDAWDENEPWHFYGSEVVTGWSYEGNSIYSKYLGWTIAKTGVVHTLFETIADREFCVKLLSAGATDEPEEGQLGFISGTVYVQLPGGENPNNHHVEIARRNTGLRTWGYAPLIVKNFVARNFLSSAIQNGISTQPVGTGFLVVENGLIEYTGNNGITAAAQNETTVCTNVTAHRCTNDGFNMRRILGTGLMTLNGCDGSYNGDFAGDSSQGCSNHTDSTMIVNGGRFNYNVSGGMVSVGEGMIDLHGDTEYGPLEIDGNMRLGNTPGVIAAQASCAWLGTTKGEVTGPVTVSNGQGVGVKVQSSGNVTGLENITSTNNALPDDV